MSFLRRLFGGSASTVSVSGPSGRGQAAGPYESSMNFDMEHVRPFLERLRDRQAIGFDVDALARFTEETEVQDERKTATSANFEGRQVPLRFSVFMDDIDAPDLYFFCDEKALIDRIDAEWEDFTEELGI